MYRWRIAGPLAYAQIQCENNIGQHDKVNATRIRMAISALIIGFGLLNPGFARHSKMIQIDESYRGREVTLAVGEDLEITLAENRSTGFQWDLTTKPEPSCTLIMDESQGAAGPPGKGGSHRWHFRAVRQGTGVIELEYRRPWENDPQPTRTVKFSVRVR
jgi:inhibitor of cysteine peptidase